MPAMTSGLKQRPRTAPARASVRASSDRRARRASTASPIVSGTWASRIRRPSVRASSSSAARSSSMWSGIPFVRSWTASTTSRGAGSSPPRISVVARPVSSSVQRPQPDLLGEPLAQQARPPLAVDRVDRELVAAIVGDDEERQVRARGGRARRSPRGSSRRPSGGPRRRASSAGRSPRGSGPTTSRTISRRAPERVAVVPAVDREEVLGERAPGRVAADPGRELADRRERDLHGPAARPIRRRRGSRRPRPCGPWPRSGGSCRDRPGRTGRASGRGPWHAAATAASSSSRTSSRPTMIGHSTVRVRLMARSLRPRTSRWHRSFDR